MAARTSALAHLLDTVPPAVLAQLIGMSAHSAERYSTALRTDYSRYAALRVGEHGTPSCRSLRAARTFAGVPNEQSP